MAALSSLYQNVLKDISAALKLPSSDEASHQMIQRATANLELLETRVSALDLFSANELLEDISTRNLIYLSVPFVMAQLYDHLKPIDNDERNSHLVEAKRFLDAFLASMTLFDVIPASETAFAEDFRSMTTDHSKRRDLKIKRYKLSKELATRVQHLQHRKDVKTEDVLASDPLSLLENLVQTYSAAEAKYDDSLDEEDLMRETTLLVLRLLWVEGISKLSNIDEELMLLRSVPLEPPQTSSQFSDRHLDESWKLDLPQSSHGSAGFGPVLDPSGKPLRPFTILPSTSRAALQAQVFRPEHRLPTMTVDEYLEEERRRGNIISGGGAASAEQPTTSEQLTIDSEMDGSLFGEQKSEEKRAKDEKWARFTDVNPRGAGNMMNRG